MTPPESPRGLTARLTVAPRWLFALYAGGAAFTAYFCMYGLRKPFDTVTFTGEKFLGTPIDLKTACVLGQILGYVVSKYVGVRVCAEAGRSQRTWLLLGAGVWSELALVAFAFAPAPLRPFAMFANGLPLGVVWGFLVRYLEGRRTSDLLLVMLSGSFVIAGAATKDFGMYLFTVRGVAELWVPALAGAVFLVPYLIAVRLLHALPVPNAHDELARSPRPSLNAAGRRAFLARIGAGFVFLVVAYFLLTAYRDFRDHYGREILQAMGYERSPGVFVRTDRWALVTTLCALGLLNLIGNHHRAIAAVFALILTGFAVIAGSTLAYRAGHLDGIEWLSAVGIGLYLAYVPFGTVLFERVVAAARFPGTSVFAVQLADGVGYTGSVLLQLYRDLVHADMDRLAFFVPLSLVVAAVGAACAVIGGLAVGRRLS
ncbi:hypothetical protein VT84_02445 [Gemmata sp. SH-PL17]|uniref:DUF5690 family protein n=1 Tax=Gemmata sp. SH-PL17 TaxID=1630693 RepID=UPI0004B41F53|nr:DUF5690 family protein [Gemmata sp. SH-PL17]AMV23240.1 hypothetical protein VT84_02445 [Gemmata sp. SH-PL17]